MPNMTLPIEKDVLSQLYTQQGNSVLFIARLLGCSSSKVSRDLRKHGIKSRPFSTKGMKVRLGAVLSDDTKNKIRAKAQGRIIPPDVRKRMGSPGNKNPGWIDGRTPEHKRLRRTTEYRQWRAAVFERDGYTCQLCGARGGDVNADHIKPFAHFPELRTVVENGRTLCVPCHRKTPTFGNKAKK